MTTTDQPEPTMHRVDWFGRDPTGGTLYLKPEPVYVKPEPGVTVTAVDWFRRDPGGGTLHVKPEPTMPLAILNTAIATAPGDYEIRPLSLPEARAVVVAAPEVLSAVGHQATAQVLTDLLGREVPVNRIQFTQQPGQSALVLKLRGRIPEGVILDVAGMEEIGYDLWLMTRRPRSLAEVRSDLDRCPHGRHGRQGRGQPDPCFACPGGVSAGNPVPVSAVVGYQLGGEEITVADLVARHDPLDPDLVEVLRLAERVKASLSGGRDPDDPVTAGEVAERLPERLRSVYWRHQLNRYFAAEGAV
jgi:hypothetical protein